MFGSEISFYTIFAFGTDIIAKYKVHQKCQTGRGGWSKSVFLRRITSGVRDRDRGLLVLLYFPITTYTQ